MFTLVIKVEINLIPNQRSALSSVMVRMSLAIDFGMMKNKKMICSRDVILNERVM